MSSSTTFGTVSYSLAAVSFLVLTILMLVSWKGRRDGVWLIVAAAITTTYSLLLAFHSADNSLPVVLIYCAEAFHDLIWIATLAVIARSAASRAMKVAAIGICVIVLGGTLVVWLLESLGASYFDATLVLTRPQLVTSLSGLIFVEQIYRNSTPSGRKSVKYFVVGVGAIFAYDLFLFSQAELLRGLVMESWNARGIILALAVPLIALSAQRTPDWSLDVFVSRHVVFYSATFLVVGAYLLVMALGGYYVREFGGEWGRVGQIVFFAGAAVALGGLLASGSLRRHAIVFLSKHFYRNKYDYRVEWLRFIQTLSSTEERNVRRTVVRAIAQIFSSPGGILLLRDESQRCFEPVAAWPVEIGALPELQKLPLESDLIGFLVRTRWIVDLREWRLSPDTYGNIALPDWLLGIRDLRIVAPLLHLDEMIGLICLYDPPPPFELTYEDRDLLKTVGRHVATHIAQDDTSRKLAESRQFEAYNRLTAFMMHDLKNSAAQLKLIVDNSARHKSNPDFIDDAIATIGNTVERISRLIEQLRGGSELERVHVVDLAKLAREAVHRCQDRVPAPMVGRTVGVRVRADAERFTAVLEHVLRNAQDATDATGSIVVHVDHAPPGASVQVVDTGAGMDAEFVRSRLFRPFDSTKGSKGMGIGAYQVREYVQHLGGSVEVQSSPGQGTTFSIILPAVSVQVADTETDVV